MLPASRFGSCLLFLPLIVVGSACSSTSTGTGTGGSDGGFQSPTSDGTFSESGGTKGALACSGTPEACAEMTSATGCREHGCRWAEPECTGTAKSCTTFSAAVCEYVPGCAWQLMFGNYQCVGQATACDERMLGGGTCDVQNKTGCSLVGGCTGTPAACSTHKSECSRFPGCRPGTE